MNMDAVPGGMGKGNRIPREMGGCMHTHGDKMPRWIRMEAALLSPEDGCVVAHRPTTTVV